MKRIRIVVLFSLIAARASLAQEQALAQWAEPSPAGRLYEEMRKSQRDQCLPLKSSIDIPIPESTQIAYVLWRRERPKCSGDDVISPDPVSSILLVSRKPIRELITWFRSALSHTKFAEYEIPMGIDYECTGKPPVSTTWVVFSRLSVAKFCWNKHVLSEPVLIIKETDESLKSHGYNTAIEYRMAPYE